MSTTPGRVICPQCGANNFNTQAACWKCGAALSGPAGPGYAPPVSSPRLSTPTNAAPSYAPTPATPQNLPSPSYASSAVDPAVAFWSTIALAFLLPSVAIPVGLVFLMLDDRRKVELGRTALIWGTVFFVLHFAVTWWMVQGTVMAMRSMLPGLSGRTHEPGLNDNVPPLKLPGMPDAGDTSAFSR